MRILGKPEKALVGLFILLALLYNAGIGYAVISEGTSARAAYVIDLATGRPLLAYNENASMPMASTTKVMTALLALERGNLDDTVVTSDNAYGMPGTSIYLGRGEALELEHMLYGLMLASGNDAAVAIAEYIGGSVDAFAELMNERAVELGGTGTHFVNPNGLPATGHVTTARDLTLIAAAAMKNPVFRDIVSTQRASIPWEGRDYSRVLRNKNALLSDYDGATGIKTGFTKAAGRCLVFGAKRGDMEIVGVVLNCSDWFQEAARLMDRCFAVYQWQQMLEDGTVVGTVLVEDGEVKEIPVVVRGSVAGPVAEDELPDLTIEISPSVTAPLPAGAQVGWATMRVNGEILDKKPLVIAEPVREKASPFLLWLRAWPMLSITDP